MDRECGAAKEKHEERLFDLPTEGPGREDLIKIYSWSFDDAWAAQEEWTKRYGPNILGRGPFFRWIGAQKLKELRMAYKAGDRGAILEALFECSLNSLPLPRWCEMAFLASYRKVRHYKAKSWDDVFGRPHPKGTHLGTKRQEREMPYLIFKRIEQIKKEEPSTPIDGALFERVGKELGIGGKTLTEGYYYRELKFHKPYQCRHCGKRFGYWHEVNRDGFCNDCERKEKAPHKNE